MVTKHVKRSSFCHPECVVDCKDAAIGVEAGEEVHRHIPQVHSVQALHLEPSQVRNSSWNHFTKAPDGGSAYGAQEEVQEGDHLL